MPSRAGGGDGGGGEGGEGELRVQPPRASFRAAKMLVMLTVPLALSCAGNAMLVPVFLPGERMDCLFEVVGEVTVQGPFGTGGDGDGPSRDVVMQSVRLEVGQEAAGTGADAVMIRAFQYDRDSSAAEDNAPEIIAVDGMLVSFVDPTCVPDG